MPLSVGGHSAPHLPYPWHLSGGEECWPRKCGFQPILALRPLQEAMPGQALLPGLKIKASWPGPCWQRGRGGGPAPGLKGVWLEKEASPSSTTGMAGSMGGPQRIAGPSASPAMRGTGGQMSGCWLPSPHFSHQVCLSPSPEASSNRATEGHELPPIPSSPHQLITLTIQLCLNNPGRKGTIIITTGQVRQSRLREV